MTRDDDAASRSPRREELEQLSPLPEAVAIAGEVAEDATALSVVFSAPSQLLRTNCGLEQNKAPCRRGTGRGFDLLIRGRGGGS